MPAPLEASASPAATGDWGVTVSNITPDLARRFDLKETTGVVVTDVVPDSPAREVGLRPGDVVKEVDRKPVHNVGEYNQALAHVTNRALFLIDRQGQSFFVALSRPE